MTDEAVLRGDDVPTIRLHFLDTRQPENRRDDVNAPIVAYARPAALASASVRSHANVASGAAHAGALDRSGSPDTDKK